jgi:hypothetical protein
LFYNSGSVVHPYTSSTARAFNNDPNSKVEFLVGWDIRLSLGVSGACKANTAGDNAVIGASLDDNTTFALSTELGYFLNYTNQYVSGFASGTVKFDAGYHYLYATESGSAGGSTFSQAQIKGTFKG